MTTIWQDNNRVLDQAVSDVRAALTPKPQPDRGELADPIAAVVQLVARHLGVDYVQRAGSVQVQLDRLGIRSRQVSLEAGWTSSTEMAMIAFTADGTALALLPRGGRRGYRVHPAGSGRGYAATRTPAHLQPVGPALALYRPLAADATGVRALLRHALVGNGRDLAALLSAGLGYSLLALAVPVSMSTLAPRLMSSTGQLWWLSLLLGVTTVTAGLLMLVRNAATVRVQGRMQAVLEPAVWGRLLEHDVAFFRSFGTGDLVQRANAIAQARKALSDVVVGAVLGAFFSLTSVLVVLAVTPVLGLLLIGALMVAAPLLAWQGRRQQQYEQQVHDGFGEVYSLLYAVLLGIDKIQTAGRELHAFARWAAIFRVQKVADAQSQRIQAQSRAITGGLQPMLYAVLLGGITVLGLHPGANDLIIASLAGGQVTLAVGQLGQLAAQAYGIAPLVRRVAPIVVSPVRPTGTGDPGVLSGAVRLAGVSFGYPGATTPTLQDIELHAEPGELVAVVGPSGAGKSTLIRLLLGFETPLTGSVHYDDQPLTELDVRLVRRQIGTVLQGGRLLRGTLLDNILGPATELEVAAAWQAAEAAGIADDLAVLPMGLQTRIGENAEGFSGGQIQRLLLARALVRRPPLLLLDEATSALDNRTQQLVSDRIAALRCTRIVVAHRLSTIRNADRIYLLDGGRVTGVGRYQELLQSSELFARLVSRQQVAR